MSYYQMMALRVVIAMAVGCVAYAGWQYAHAWVSVSFVRFLLGGMVLGCSVLAAVTVIYFASFSSFRKIIRRFLNVLMKR